MAQYVFEVLSLDAVTPQGLRRTRLQGVAIRTVTVTVSTTAIRIRFDGGDPTPTVGHVHAVNTTFQLHGADAVRNLRLIATAATAEVAVTGEAQ